MEHLEFKSDQTAAAYVADGLDPHIQEAFELHLMSCPECVNEVESWRAIKEGLIHEGREPAEAAARVAAAGTHAAAPASRTPVAAPRVPARAAKVSRDHTVSWRTAVTFAVTALAGVMAGWFGHSAQAPWSDAEATLFYTLSPVARGAVECTPVRLPPASKILALRIPGAALEQRLVALDSDGHDLSPERYAVTAQADGSWVVRVKTTQVTEQGLHFEARSLDGSVEPRGCIVNAPRF
ncbi:MAG TPA: zf-HC2 domain-containing protein [Steroidobacteraceae bacterium]|nr:zf-HC2 domain-containing protein [Steroidobacteraceae bacterium]